MAVSFLIVADDCPDLIGMALGMQGLADDGAGDSSPGLCHVAMVFGEHNIHYELTLTQ